MTLLEALDVVRILYIPPVSQTIILCFYGYFRFLAQLCKDGLKLDSAGSGCVFFPTNISTIIFSYKLWTSRIIHSGSYAITSILFL